MHQQSRALDVAQELCAQARSGVRAFDQARNVGDHETLFFSLFASQHHTKVRFEGGERIIGNLRPGRRDDRNERRLAHVRISYQSNVGEQFQLQAEVALFTRTSFFMLARRLVRGSGELGVAASAASAARDHDTFIGVRKIVDLLACILVVNDRAHRHLQDNSFTVAASFLVALAMASALGLVFRIETEMNQGIVAFARFHPDVAALAAVAARRPAPGDKLLAPERHAAVAAVPSLDSDFGFIDKHDVYALMQFRAATKKPRRRSRG